MRSAHRNGEDLSWARETCDLVAAAGLDMSRWAELPGRITTRFPGANFIVQGSDKKARTSLGGYFSGVEKSAFDAYEQHYCAISPWLAFWERAPVSSVFVSERIAPSRPFRDTEFYCDFLVPQRMLCAVGAKLFEDSDRMAFMAAHYEPRDADRHERRLAAAFSALIPAMRASMSLNRHLADEAAQIGMAGQVLDAVGLPALAIDMRGAARSTNALGAELLQRGRLLRERGGRVCLADPNAATQLARALKHSGAGAPSNLVLRDADGFVTAIANLLPVTTEALKLPQAPWLFEPERLVLMLIRERKELARPPEGPLVAAFGLTPAEARLAAHLATGETLESAAERLGIHKETARSQLKKVFAKTGVSRQATLVARFAHLRSAGTA
jgi:DNA-binding CsgD family transcriptional regulator